MIRIGGPPISGKSNPVVSGLNHLVSFNFCDKKKSFYSDPGDFRSWKSPQTLPALFIGPFEHIERFRNLNLLLKRSQTFRVLF